MADSGVGALRSPNVKVPEETGTKFRFGFPLRILSSGMVTPAASSRAVPIKGGRNSRGEDQALFTEIGDAPPKRHSRCVPASGRSVPGSTDHDHKPNISSHADSNGAHMDAAGRVPPDN